MIKRIKKYTHKNMFIGRCQVGVSHLKNQWLHHHHQQQQSQEVDLLLLLVHPVLDSGRSNSCKSTSLSTSNVFLKQLQRLFLHGTSALQLHFVNVSTISGMNGMSFGRVTGTKHLLRLSFSQPKS